MQRPSVKSISELFTYDPDTGIVRWCVPHGRWNRFPAGTQAGWIGSAGSLYTDVILDGIRTKHPITHIIWVLVHGRWPDKEIDHKNCNNSDNKLVNLREATRAQNMGNTRLRNRNISRFKGVSLHPKTGLWRPRIKVNRSEISLGYFRAVKDAHKAYCEAAKEYFGEFARLA